MPTKRVLSRGSPVSVLPHQGRIDARRCASPPGPLPPAYSGRHAGDGTSPRRRIVPYPSPRGTVLGTSETAHHTVDDSSGPTATLFDPSPPTVETRSNVVLVVQWHSSRKEAAFPPFPEGKGLPAVRSS